jgi:hypothetical protein
VATLVFAQSEVNPANTDTEALFGYFENCEVPPSNEDIERLFENRQELRKNGTLHVPACLGWWKVEFDPTPQPNVLSQRAGLQRFQLGVLG